LLNFNSVHELQAFSVSCSLLTRYSNCNNVYWTNALVDEGDRYSVHLALPQLP